MGAAEVGDLDVHVTWRPFLLNPDTPPEGLDRKRFFAARAAADPERFTATRKALEAAAEEAGCDLHLDAPQIIPNTINAHRLLLWAQSQGEGVSAIEALFTAYWRNGLDLNNPEILKAIAGVIGLEPEIVADLLPTDADRATVLQSHAVASQMGIHGVPVALFNRKVGMQGAQAPADFAKGIREALA